MDQDTGGTAIRVSHRTARDSVIRLRKALETLDIHTTEIRNINAVADISGGYHIRMGTWEAESAFALADAVEGLHEALEEIRVLKRPRPIEHPDATPQPPAAS
jgi:hypothetical protein